LTLRAEEEDYKIKGWSEVLYKKYSIKFQINNKKIFINISVLILFVLIFLFIKNSLISKMLYLVGYFTIIAAHEYGHILIAHKKGYSVDGVLIHAFGGVCIIEYPDTELDHIIISWGGVIIQGFIALIAFLITFFWQNNNFFREYIYNVFFGLNTIIILFNIIPLPFLDGGSMWKIIGYWNKKMVCKISKNNNVKTRMRKLTEDMLKKARKEYENSNK
jgi:Zn-dependent protease